MRRFGYTLTETLVAMAVIAVVAVICAPLVNSFRPDEYKAKFLSIYDAIVESTITMASNRRLYPIEEEIHIYAPLLNTNIVSLDDENSYGGQNKYCKLLAMAMGNGEYVNCTEENFTLSPSNYSDKLDNISFTSPYGVDFYVGTDSADPDKFQINVLFDVDGVGNGKDCFYIRNACTHPDRFAITIAANGNVEVADAIGRMHLKRRNSLRLNKDQQVNTDDNFDHENTYLTIESIENEN